jgi:hypothetical protein
MGTKITKHMVGLHGEKRSEKSDLFFKKERIKWNG